MGNDDLLIKIIGILLNVVIQLDQRLSVTDGKRASSIVEQIYETEGQLSLSGIKSLIMDFKEVVGITLGDPEKNALFNDLLGGSFFHLSPLIRGIFCVSGIVKIKEDVSVERLIFPFHVLEHYLPIVLEFDVSKLSSLEEGLSAILDPSSDEESLRTLLLLYIALDSFLKALVPDYINPVRGIYYSQSSLNSSEDFTTFVPSLTLREQDLQLLIRPGIIESGLGNELGLQLKSFVSGSFEKNGISVSGSTFLSAIIGRNSFVLEKGNNLQIEYIKTLNRSFSLGFLFNGTVDGLETRLSFNENENNNGFDLSVSVVFTVSLQKPRLTNADSFLASVISSVESPESIELGVRLDKKGNFSFLGGGLEYKFKLHPPKIRSFPHVNEALLSLGFDDGLILSAGFSLKASIGNVVGIIVERFGAQSQISQDANDGISGDIDFLPPRGVGLSIDTSSISGGGYLFFEPENHRYGGAAQLQLPAINLKAVGLITTRLPDGSKGFSFLIIISAEFQPIQLSFGFTLNGVGGILGINRALDADALRQGMKSGALDSVLFPEDILNNIPKIVSDLRAIFPPTADQYLFGPTAILGWGTAGVPDEDGVVPSLVTAKLGIVLELPSPFRLSLLGSIRMTFPHPLTPLVDIRLDLFGVIDFGARTAALDAVLFDSRIQLYQVSGDMAFRMKFGEETDFIFSLGGFHPAFTPPPEIPALDRLAVSIGLGDNPRIRLAAYLALTPNTLQIGALLDLYAEKGKFAAKGQLGFDTLITFSPFGFDGRMFGKLDLLAAGTRLMNVDMEVILTGPTPWRARGTATFKVLKLQHSISFDETFGTPEPAPLPVVEVWPELETAIENVANWTTQIPGADERAVKVTFRKADEVDGEVLVHPGSTLGFVQRVAPLGLTLEKFGKAYPEGEDYFELESLSIQTAPGQTEALVSQGQQSQFAPGEYLELTDDEKLSRPSFEKMDAGWTAQGLDGLEVYGSGWARERNYEALVVDQEYQATVVDESQTQGGTYTPADLINQVASSVGARRQRKFGAQGVEQFATSSRMGISLSPTAYNVTELNQPASTLSGTTSAPTTYAQQQQAKERVIQGASLDDMSYHVIATHESGATYAP